MILFSFAGTIFIFRIFGLAGETSPEQLTKIWESLMYAAVCFGIAYWMHITY